MMFLTGHYSPFSSYSIQDILGIDVNMIGSVAEAQ